MNIIFELGVFKIIKISRLSLIVTNSVDQELLYGFSLEILVSSFVSGC